MATAKTATEKKTATKKTVKKAPAKSAAKKAPAKKTSAAPDKLKLENAALKARVTELEKTLKDIGKTLVKTVK